MARSTWNQLQRNLYLLQRGMGDISAAQRGPAVLGKRLLRRRLTRSIWAPLLRAFLR
jgi:hypothetical protein